MATDSRQRNLQKREPTGDKSSKPQDRGLFLSLALLVLMGSIWGLMPTLVKLSTEANLPYLDMLSIGIFGHSACFGAYLIVKNAWFRLTLSRLSFFLVSGSFGIFLPFLLRIICASYLPAGLMALVLSTTPVMAVGLALILRTETVSSQRVLGIGFALIAGGLILWPETDIPDSKQSQWILLLFLTPLSYATAQVIIYKRWPVGLKAGQVAAGESLVAATVLIPIFLIWSDPAVLFGSWREGVGPILLWVLVGFLATMIFYVLIQHRGPIFTSSATFVAVFSGLFWGWTFFSERLTMMMIVATTMFVLSLLMIVFQKSESRKKDAETSA